MSPLPRNYVPLSLILETLKVWQKHSSAMENTLKSIEERIICVLNTIEIEIQKEEKTK